MNINHKWIVSLNIYSRIPILKNRESILRVSWERGSLWGAGFEIEFGIVRFAHTFLNNEKCCTVFPPANSFSDLRFFCEYIWKLFGSPWIFFFYGVFLYQFVNWSHKKWKIYSNSRRKNQILHQRSKQIVIIFTWLLNKI